MCLESERKKHHAPPSGSWKLAKKSGSQETNSGHLANNHSDRFSHHRISNTARINRQLGLDVAGFRSEDSREVALIASIRKVTASPITTRSASARTSAKERVTLTRGSVQEIAGSFRPHPADLQLHALQTISISHRFQFHADRIGNRNNRTSFEGKSRQHRTELVHFQRVVTVHQHIAAPIPDADNERLDLEIRRCLPRAEDIQDALLCFLILNR